MCSAEIQASISLWRWRIRDARSGAGSSDDFGAPSLDTIQTPGKNCTARPVYAQNKTK
jgi:hypothetical protein